KNYVVEDSVGYCSKEKVRRYRSEHPPLTLFFRQCLDYREEALETHIEIGVDIQKSGRMEHRAIVFIVPFVETRQTRRCEVMNTTMQVPGMVWLDRILLHVLPVPRIWTSLDIRRAQHLVHVMR